MDADYLTTHPWLTFDHHAHIDSDAVLWSLLGAAFSQCRHLAGTPLAPQVAAELSQVYFAKGALVTTAIEGNTLTEDEATAIIAGTKELPPSRRYLQREVENVARTPPRTGFASRTGRSSTVSASTTMSSRASSPRRASWLASIGAHRPRTCPT